MLLEASACTGLRASDKRDGESSAKCAVDRALRKHHKPNLYNDSHKLLFILSC